MLFTQLRKVYDINYKHVAMQVFIILISSFPIFLINEFSREI